MILCWKGECGLGGKSIFTWSATRHWLFLAKAMNSSFIAAPKTQQNTKFCRAHVYKVSKVVCKMKRMGGGFYGKETRSVFISSAVAVAAYTLNKPVRMET